ncbi:MAG: HAD-IB family hydrolase [Coriobacteriales bacterium]|nr:HAD-IB family hydrolase [Coriobacteriales bacterium]
MEATMNKVVVATRNAHKLKELQAIVDAISPNTWRLITMSEAGIVGAAKEDGDSFAANALLKARYAHEATGYAAIADDSGLVVDALGGAPGIYSARYAVLNTDDNCSNKCDCQVNGKSDSFADDKSDIFYVEKNSSHTGDKSDNILSSKDATQADDKANTSKLLKELASLNDDNRNARFVCAMVFIASDGKIAESIGTIEGKIACMPCGTSGFGYDPVFIPTEDNPNSKTLAEYCEHEKNKVSHRFRAMQGLCEKLFSTNTIEPLVETTVKPANDQSSVETGAMPAGDRSPSASKLPYRIAVFDYDGTVIDASSPVRLIFRLIKDRIIPVRVGTRIAGWGLRYKMGAELDQAKPRRQIFRSLRKFSATDANAIMQNLYREELKRFERPDAIRCLQELKKQGVRIVIVSASFEPMVREFAKAIGADGWVATEMEILDGYYTGETVREPPEGEQKLIQFTNFANERYGEGNWCLEWAFGDHFSDVPLMQTATNPIAVDPDNRLERIAKERRWQIVKWPLE